MTAVVSDTSPLNYLILIEAIDCLPRIFSQVFIPPAVAVELTREQAPGLVRDWTSAPPSWLTVKAPTNSRHSFNLDEGEAQAILLAKELGILSLLIDERKGFAVAESVGLEPIGLIGILEYCAQEKWIDFEDKVARLQEHRFRIHERVLKQVRDRLRAAV